ncbi:MAG: PD40 domain-containing protein [Planctomycetes bacterium]|nr:PD40 domain-containing protein [Planctomycetota bacterium]
MTRRAALLAAGLLAACGESGSSRAPIVADQPPELIYARVADASTQSESDLYTATRQMLDPRKRTTRNGVELHVRMAPDGNRFAFTRELALGEAGSREIYVSSLDGTVAETRLTANAAVDETPCWSPDGTALLFSTDRDGAQRLWTMGADGADPRPVTAGLDRDPDWTSAGVVFARTEIGGSGTRSRIYRMQPDGSGLVPLTDGGPGPGDREPALSPDGSRVVFARLLGTGASRLCAVSSAGGPVTALGDGLGEDRAPRFSRGGDRIVAALARPLEGMAGLRLCVLDPDGANAAWLVLDQRYQVSGADFLPRLVSWPPPGGAALRADLGRGLFRLMAGQPVRGTRDALREADDRPLTLATQAFSGREIAGFRHQVPLPVAQATEVDEVTIAVRAALSRVDGDTALRISVRNTTTGRYEVAVDKRPRDTAYAVTTLRFASLAHVDRDASLEIELSADFAPGERAEFAVDAVTISVR